MRTDEEILKGQSNGFKAMKEARLDTLLHLKDQMTVNAKKLTGESCVKLVEQLIEEIKR